MLPQFGGKSAHQNKTTFHHALAFIKIFNPMKEKLLVLLRTRCEQSRWMGEKTMKEECLRSGLAAKKVESMGNIKAVTFRC